MKCQGLRVLFVGLSMCEYLHSERQQRQLFHEIQENGLMLKQRNMSVNMKLTRKSQTDSKERRRGVWLENQTVFQQVPPVLMQRKRQSTFLTPVISTAMIHWDGVRAQVFTPLPSIKSQALEQEMKNNFPIFGGNKFGKMA